MIKGQEAKAEAFRALHIARDPVILFNVWDAGSALVVVSAGAKAIATGSWSVAAACGFPDGESMPLDLVLENAERIAVTVDLPVTIDMVRGYGEQPAEIAQTMRQLWSAGAVGCNIEDSLPDGSGLSSLAEQAERLRSAKGAAPSLFLNARVDLFLRAPSDRHDEALLDQAIARAAAYIEAGADGIFVPGLTDKVLIESFCRSCAAPVNILAVPGGPSAADHAALGVARISHGPWPYRQAMARLEEAARAALA